jgi:DNA-binding response OmpR family regulator
LAHILIVDDDANTLASLARAFRLAGHAATVCDNAPRALDLVKSQPFDMLLSDVVMPGKDGLSLLEDLRSFGISLPVVMVSGQANIEMAVRATRLGAADFLEKPLSTDKLLLTVDTSAWAGTSWSIGGLPCAASWRRWTAWPPARPASASWARPERARNSLRARCMSAAPAGWGLS